MSLRRVIFVIYEGFELLDLSGPIGVFSTANSIAEQPLYELIVASSEGGAIVCSAGVVLSSVSLADIRFADTDTILAVGAARGPLLSAMSDALVRHALLDAAIVVERYGSVCSGAFLLAACGLLDGKRCATHWVACEELARSFRATVVSDALFVTDGRLWTSAGVTTGIDMALCMLEQDHGTTLMGKVAKSLVLYSRRPGHQSQFSQLLQLQTAAKGEFAPIVEWLTGALDQPIRVSDMARRMAMSERTFYRKFTAEIGIAPSKFLEAIRLDRARELLEAGHPIKTVAHDIGFRSHAAFRTAFKARFGISPSLHAGLHDPN